MLQLHGPSAAAGADPAGRWLWLTGSVVVDSQASQRRTGEVLEALERVISGRKGGDPARSYTARLLAGGPPAAGAKVTEEAGELVRAATGEPDDRVVAEAADLLYHTLVLLACRGVTLDQVEAELARRFGVSGLDEKAARRADGGQA
jgi:phosphoribosyl-ATP pyrophosphohydrolase